MVTAVHVRYQVVYRPGAFTNAARGHHHPVAIILAAKRFETRQHREAAEHFVRVANDSHAKVAKDGIRVFVLVPDTASRVRMRMEALYEFEQFIQRELDGMFQQEHRIIHEEPSR